MSKVKVKRHCTTSVTHFSQPTSSSCKDTSRVIFDVMTTPMGKQSLRSDSNDSSEQGQFDMGTVCVVTKAVVSRGSNVPQCH